MIYILCKRSSRRKILIAIDDSDSIFDLTIVFLVSKLIRFEVGRIGGEELVS
jgi:hypothetical protein